MENQKKSKGIDSNIKLIDTFICFVLLFLLLLLAGCTTPSQWQADQLVDELCDKDGGIKVYETVILPEERFNEWGQFTGIAFGKDTKPDDEYYRIHKVNVIQRNKSGDFGGLSISQHHTLIYRRSDQKLLGEFISYARQGGDLTLSAHPSAYICKQWKESRLDKQVFLKANN